MTVSISGVTGNVSHGKSITIGGSGFNTKATAAPVVWDDCEGSDPTALWTLAWPNAAASTYNLNYRTPSAVGRGVSLPYARATATKYLCGSHAGSGSNGGQNVMVWKGFGSVPGFICASWWARADPNWTFGDDDNYKCWDWTIGSSGGYDSVYNYYGEYNPRPTSPSSTPSWHLLDDSGFPTGTALRSPDQNGHNWYWNDGANPMSNWAFHQLVIKLSSGTDGYIKQWEDGVLVVNYAGYTEGYPTSGRAVGIGGYARNYNQTGNWRYFKDLYVDTTPQRVVLANNATLANATVLSTFIPSAWSDTSITATVNLGAFGDSGTAYLFVFDATGAANSTGYAVTLVAEPTITGVSGNLSHGTAFTISGSNFKTKAHAGPAIWDDFDGIANGVSVASGNLSGAERAPLIAQGIYSTYGDWQRTASGGTAIVANTTSPKARRSSHARSSLAGYSRDSFVIDVENFSTGQERLISFYMRHNLTSGGAYPRQLKFWLMSNANGDTQYHSTAFDNCESGGYRIHRNITGVSDEFPSPEITGPAANNEWTRVCSYIRQTASGVADGEWEQFNFRPNKSGGPGVSKSHLTGIALRGSGTPAGDPDWLQIGGSYYSQCSAETMTIDVSEIYVDSTRARVEIGNAATWDACTFAEIQVCTAWADGSITIGSVNLGHFGSVGTAYVYVFDSDGVVNSAGYAVTLGPSPITVHASGRYLLDGAGSPLLLHGDTPWSIAAQLTNSEIDTYLANRSAKGFKAIMFNAIEHYFTSQSPEYLNADGNAPFSSMTDFASTPVEAYWSRVDYIVNQCLSLGIVCVINPAYLGYNGGTEGWMSEVTAETAGDLQAYGAWLANRYTQGNVIWCMGGDYAGTTTERDKQWNIVTGIRSVRTTDIIMAHGAPGNGAYPSWNGYAGWNLNSAYPNDSNPVYSDCLTEYGRSGPLPFVMQEANYEQENSSTAADLRRQSYTALLSGACGQFFGNNPIWNFESPNALFSYTGTWESNLDSTGSAQQAYLAALFDAFEWWKLVPKTDTSFVTSALSSGNSRICPALADDGSFGMIWVPSSQSVTVVMSAMAPSSVRARLYNPTTGSYSTVSGSPFSNSGTQNIATGGERVLVLDQEPGSGGLDSSIAASHYRMMNQ